MDSMMDYDFQFTGEENRQLVTLLREIDANPYADYLTFMDRIDDLRDDTALPSRFADFCAAVVLRDFAEQPWVVIGNSPIDDDLPVFDSANPVSEKYRIKRTFVSEGFLALYGRLTNTEIIGHLSVNEGDFFHDIYPKESMFESQSQKTLGTLSFHRDFANHFVSPDFVNTLTLRDTPNNLVYSTFTATAPVVRELPARTRRVLTERRFHTPYDDVSTKESDVRLGEAADHCVIGPDGVRVFEGRTVGRDREAQAALEEFVAALHRNKRLRTSVPGDSVSFSNRHVIHGREVREIRDLDQLKHRWLMKTHNVFSLSTYEEFFLTNRYGVVNG